LIYLPGNFGADALADIFLVKLNQGEIFNRHIQGIRIL
jgi:hypothetical protein